MNLLPRLLFFLCFISSCFTCDENGYILYCPCMGRFGNQADSFLGALAFSKGVNRTLVLPPWVEYHYGAAKSQQVPFDTYFKVDSIQKYHRAVTMEYFMNNIADKIWPDDKRTSFCYVKRTGVEGNSCNAKDGNPFGPFWDTFNINFVKSEFYAPLHYDIHRPENLKGWLDKFPPNEYPVIAFTGAPASFPVQAENRDLQKYLKWSDNISKRATEFIKSELAGGAFVGIHLRNGGDWVRACRHVADSPLLFAAPQCVGYRGERGPLTSAMCLPSAHDVIKQLKRTIKHVKDVKWVFVSSDADHMVEELERALQRSGVRVTRQQSTAAASPHLDLALLASAHHFIGNCVSSFTAFVKRERDSRGLPSTFWGYPPRKKNKHDEL